MSNCPSATDTNCIATVHSVCGDSLAVGRGLAVDFGRVRLQMVERCSWHWEARRVAGLHLVSMVIWVLKLLPLLPMEGCWYLVSAPRKRCSIHLRHLRLISACTWRRGGGGGG